MGISKDLFTCPTKSSQHIIFRMKIVVVSCLVVVLSGYLEASLVDVNKDGVYDRNEYHWAFPQADLYQDFAKIDTNNDGLVTDEELEVSKHLAFNGRDLEELDRNNRGFNERVLCENSQKPATITCGRYKIKITAANYGRQNPGSQVCPHPTLNTSVTNCIGGRNKVEKTCNNRQSCTMLPNANFFGNPCP